MMVWPEAVLILLGTVHRHSLILHNLYPSISLATCADAPSLYMVVEVVFSCFARFILTFICTCTCKYVAGTYSTFIDIFYYKKRLMFLGFFFVFVIFVCVINLKMDLLFVCEIYVSHVQCTLMFMNMKNHNELLYDDARCLTICF